LNSRRRIPRPSPITKLSERGISFKKPMLKTAVMVGLFDELFSPARRNPDDDKAIAKTAVRMQDQMVHLPINRTA